MFLSIVFPAYNEEKNIRLGALDKVSRYFEHQKYSWEVIIVNDGSTDETGKLLDDFARSNEGVSVIHSRHLGKAGTVSRGILAAKGDIVLFSDLDQATPIQESEKILPFFKQGYDVVIGSRNSKREGAPILRFLMARGFMIIRSLLLDLNGITDTQCGFKAFRKAAAERIFKNLQLYGEQKGAEGAMVTAGFDIEVLYLAKRMGFLIKEVPVEWHYVETRRVNPLKDSWEGLLDIIKIRINAWKGVYTHT